MQVAHPRHRAGACTLNAVGLLPVSGRGDARVAPPCPTTLCVKCSSAQVLDLKLVFCEIEIDRRSVWRDPYNAAKRDRT